MLNACTKLRHFTRGKDIINRILAENNPVLVRNPTLVTTMIDLLVSLTVVHIDYNGCSTIHQGKAGNDIELCIQLFNSIEIQQRTSFLYSAMIKAYNKSDMPRETLKLFDQIVNDDGHVHDPIHFILVFNACMLEKSLFAL